MIDKDDFDEVWTAKQNSKLFLLYATLLRDAWRQDKPQRIRERYFEITLRRNQLILHIRQIARVLDLPESTLRDRLSRLEALEAIRIDEPVSGIKVVSILRAYNYGEHGERIPCEYRAPSVVDRRTRREQSEQSPLENPSNELSSNNISPTDTDRLTDWKMKDCDKEHLLVKDSDYFSEDLDEIAAKYAAEDPSLTREQAREWALDDLRRGGPACHLA